MSPRWKRRCTSRIGHDDEKLFAAAGRLMREMRLESLIITRGRDGMVAFEKDAEPVAIPIYGSDQVVDVTGAGDTVIATFTAALAAGADTVSAARLANFAGGIVVMKRGTATVTGKELLAAIDQLLGNIGVSESTVKIFSRDALRNAGRRVAARWSASRAGQWLLRSAARRARSLFAAGRRRSAEN